MKTILLILLPLFTYCQPLQGLFKIPANDPESWQTHTYSIKSGNTGSYFIISQNGTVYVKRTAYETFVRQRTWKLVFQVQDDGIMQSKDGYFLADKLTTLREITVTLRKSNLQYLTPIIIDTPSGDTIQAVNHNWSHGGDGVAVDRLCRTYAGGLAQAGGSTKKEWQVQEGITIRCGAIKSALELAN